MPEGRRPSPGACEKPRAGTFAVAWGGEAQVGGGEGLRMADAARVWAICSRSHGEAPVDGERVCDGQTRQERGRAVFGRAEEAQVGEGEGPANGGRGKRVGKPFSVARGKRRSEGVGLQMGGRGKSAGKAVFGRVREAQVGGREGPANGRRGKGAGKPFAVASGKRNGHWDRWEDRVGECGQGHAGWSGQALAGKRALRGARVGEKCMGGGFAAARSEKPRARGLSARRASYIIPRRGPQRGRVDLQMVRVELSRLLSSPQAARREVSEADVRALAASIAEHGLLCPLLVRRAGAGYALVAGERRLRALRLLGWESAPCLLAAADDLESSLMALVENIQRQELHYLDEAEACRAILREHGLTQEELARRLGRSPSALANRLRLLKLPEEVRAALRESPALGERHARALLKLPDAGLQFDAVRRAAREKMGVRALEALVERLAQPKPPRGRVRRVFRDGRMFVNAVLNTVRELNALGVPAATQVRRLPGRIEITVTLPERVDTAPEGAGRS